jgi:sortase A
MWRRAGIALLVIAALAVSFVAFELFGTTLIEAQDQATLARELAGELPGKPPMMHSYPSLQASLKPPGPGSPIGIITIPAIGLEKVVVQGVGTSDLREGPGHYPSTPLPGQAGNVAIAGHRTTFGAPFFRLGELRPGESIDFSTPWGDFRYLVQDLSVVPPSDISVLDQTGSNELTLTTCNPPYSAATRLVVRAALASEPVAQIADPVPSGSAGPLGGAGPSNHAPPPDSPGSRWHEMALLAALLATSAAAGLALHRRLPLPARVVLWLIGLPLWAAVLVGFYSVVSLQLPGTF